MRLGCVGIQDLKARLQGSSWNLRRSPRIARNHSVSARGFPHDFFSWLRTHEPLWWHEPTQSTPNGVGFWVVSRYDDVVTVFKDAETYSSELGGTQIYDGKGMGYQLNQTDDPKHRRLRALVNKGFTPRMIGLLEDELRTRTRRGPDQALLVETLPTSVPAVASANFRSRQSAAPRSAAGGPGRDHRNCRPRGRCGRRQP